MKKMERLWHRVLKEFPEDAPADEINTAAIELEARHYEPVLLIRTPGFLRMRRNDLETEIRRVREMSPQEMRAEGFAHEDRFNELKAKHLQLLIYHYGLLCRLRLRDPEAWDTVNELYEDD